jgi:hypothetical protein
MPYSRSLFEPADAIGESMRRLHMIQRLIGERAWPQTQRSSDKK